MTADHLKVASNISVKRLVFCLIELPHHCMRRCQCCAKGCAAPRGVLLKGGLRTKGFKDPHALKPSADPRLHSRDFTFKGFERLRVSSNPSISKDPLSQTPVMHN